MSAAAAAVLGDEPDFNIDDPVEVFERFDADGSGLMDMEEFRAMLPHIGIKITDAKAARYFRMCDADGSGEIDLEEMRAAMYTCNSAQEDRTVGYQPNNCLTPKDVFDMFDETEDGTCSEEMMTNMLEYMEIELSERKFEKLFFAVDIGMKEFLFYNEFKNAWLKICDIKKELRARGEHVPRLAYRPNLVHKLDRMLMQEEELEYRAMEEAKWWNTWRVEKEKREKYVFKARSRAKVELYSALDGGGQVYVYGRGRKNQFGISVNKMPEMKFPQFTNVQELWDQRVEPPPPPPPPPPKTGKAFRDRRKDAVENAKATQNQMDMEAEAEESKGGTTTDDNNAADAAAGNVLHEGSIKPKRQKAAANDVQAAAALILTEWEWFPGDEPDDDASDADEEELLTADAASAATLAYDKFRGLRVNKNTSWFWGRGVKSVAIGTTVMYALTDNGDLYCWGGQNNWWKPIEGLQAKYIWQSDPVDGLVTPRSTALKQTHYQASLIGDDAVPNPVVEEARLRSRAAEELEQSRREEYESLSLFLDYYGKLDWEDERLDGKNSERERVDFLRSLVPLVKFEDLVMSMEARGLDTVMKTRKDLVDLAVQAFKLELEKVGRNGHATLKEIDDDMRWLHAKKKVSAAKKTKLDILATWQHLRAYMSSLKAVGRTQFDVDLARKQLQGEEAFLARKGRRIEAREDVHIDFADREANTVNLSFIGLTARGPPNAPQRGGSTVLGMAVGPTHAMVIHRTGDVYSFGSGVSGKLGHGVENVDDPEEKGIDDEDYPRLMESFRGNPVKQVACGTTHSACVTIKGELFVWGRHVDGQLGIAEMVPASERDSAVKHGIVTKTLSTKQLADFNGECVLTQRKVDEDACMVSPWRLKLPNARRILQVSCGKCHTACVSTNGGLYIWGSGDGGKLGLGYGSAMEGVHSPALVPDLPRIYQVSCGATTTGCVSELRERHHGKGLSRHTVLEGGHVYIAGSAHALGKFLPTFERWNTAGLQDKHCRQVSMGTFHQGVVTYEGELYTWGINIDGCAGHRTDDRFIVEPRLVNCLFRRPRLLSERCRTRQSSTAYERYAHAVVDGDTCGEGIEYCNHTQFDDRAWIEIDLGKVCTVTSIKIWNRTDAFMDESLPADTYCQRLFPVWILVNSEPFEFGGTALGLEMCKKECIAAQRFTQFQRCVEWKLPIEAAARFVRVQQDSMNYLHIAQVQVFGIEGCERSLGKVSSVECGDQVTAAIIRPAASLGVGSQAEDLYMRAVLADPAAAKILREYETYEDLYWKYGRGEEEKASDRPCRLCVGSLKCEICQFYENCPTHDLPTDGAGGAVGLEEVIDLVLEKRRPPRPVWDKLPEPPTWKEVQKMKLEERRKAFEEWKEKWEDRLHIPIQIVTYPWRRRQRILAERSAEQNRQQQLLREQEEEARRKAVEDAEAKRFKKVAIKLM